MKKNDFIYSGSALYRISKIENNLVKVVPTSRKMTCSLASRTYHQSQLEDLGYRPHPLNTTTIQNSTEKKSTNSFLHCTRMI